MSHEYKVLEKKEDPMDSVIEKSNIKTTFSMRDIQGEERAMEKLIRELEGKLSIEKAKMANIEEHHPFVKSLSEQDCFTVYMYETAHAYVRSIEPKLKELKEGLIESHAEVEEIKKQTGLEMAPTAPFANAPVAEPVKTNEEKPKEENKENA